MSDQNASWSGMRSEQVFRIILNSAGRNETCGPAIPVQYSDQLSYSTYSRISVDFLPPPGGYVIILVCMCVCVCVYVCLSVNTITQEIINILTPNFAHTFAIA